MTFRAYPQFLAQKLEDAILQGAVVPRAAVDFGSSLATWKAFHAALAANKALLPEVIPTCWPDDSDDARRNPLVSVCITHFNRPDKLKVALRSIQEQTYANLEVIVVDDGRTDAEALAYLEQLEEEFAPRGWRVVRQPNLRPDAARNNGARQAKGEYILFMDDDNCAKPNEIEVFLRCAQYSGAEFLTCFSDTFSDAGSAADFEAEERLVFLGDDLSLGAVCNCFGDSNSFIRLSSFLEIGGFTEDFGAGREDHELFARAVLSGLTLMVVPEPLYWYCKDDGRRSIRNRTNLAGPLRVAKCYKRFLPVSLRPMIDLDGVFS